jgi:tetratricopeptide (TPR) repeat protein
MASLIHGYEYDIFISYRQKDNKGDRWVSEFVEALKTELESTFKEEISVYFDINPHDGLLETHDVGASLKEKLKCLIFIPIISRTYCDPKSFAWEHEFKPFVEQALKDKFGLKVKLANGNVASRVLPVRIHDLDSADIKECEFVLGGVLRGIEFIYKEAGIDKPLLPGDDEKKNLNNTKYKIQLIKVSHAIKEIILEMKKGPIQKINEEGEFSGLPKDIDAEGEHLKAAKPRLSGKLKLISTFTLIAFIIIAGLAAYPKIFKKDTLKKLRQSGEKISVAVMPFQNMTNDTIWNVWQNGIQEILTNSLSNSEELTTIQSESINDLIQQRRSSGLTSVNQSFAGKISRKVEADLFIYGNIIQAGSTIRLYATLNDSKTGNIVKSLQVEGPAQEQSILTLIDSLTTKARNILLISELEKENVYWKNFTSTFSPAAYKYFLLGKKAYEERNYKNSVDWLQQAIDIDTNFTVAIKFIGSGYQNLGNYSEAKKWFLKLRSKKYLMSTKEKIYSDYSYAQIFETPDIAIKYLKQYLEIDEQSPQVHQSMGYAYGSLWQYDKAVPHLEKVIEIYNKWGTKPGASGAYIRLGNAYHQSGQYEKEKKLYDKAELEYPNDPYITLNRAILSFVQRDTIAGDRYIQKYLLSFDKNSQDYELSRASALADIYSAGGLKDKAEGYYRKALELSHESSDRQYVLAYFLINNDRNVDEGLEQIDKALVSNPDSYYYLHCKGWGLFKKGKYQEALKILQRSWDKRMEEAVYNHEAFLHLEAAKKAVAGMK